MVLKQICTMQMLYRASSPTNSYWAAGATGSSANTNAFTTIDVEIPANAVYEYTITVAGNDFEATATAELDGDATVDTWTIHSDGNLQCANNDATG